MPVNASAVGIRTEPVIHEVDARWIMAYSASLGDTQGCYFDTTQDDGVVAHPLFSICPEWPVMLETRDLLLDDGLTPCESKREVHAGHDVQIHRLVRPGDRLYTQATIMSIEKRSAGAFMVTRLETSDELGEAIATTFQGGLYRDVDVMGTPGVPAGEIPPPPKKAPSHLAPAHITSIPVDTNVAHIYTECARIWNPIHTDLEVAKAAGLPDIILHGSATLALAVSKVVELQADGDPTQVRRVAGAFRGMVLMPSDLELRIYPGTPMSGTREIPFEILNVDGRPAISNAVVVLGPPEF